MSLIFQNVLSGCSGWAGGDAACGREPPEQTAGRLRVHLPLLQAGAPAEAGAGQLALEGKSRSGSGDGRCQEAGNSAPLCGVGLTRCGQTAPFSAQEAGRVSGPAFRRGACRHWHGHVSAAFPRPASLLAGFSPGHPRRPRPASASAHRLEGPRSCSDGPAPQSCVVPVRAVAAHLPCVWARAPGVGGTPSGALAALGAPLQPDAGVRKADTWHTLTGGCGWQNWGLGARPWFQVGISACWPFSLGFSIR